MSFILENIDEIVAEWEAFARTATPAADTMDSLALRDHARQMLEAMARDIETWQSSDQQEAKSKGLGPVFLGKETAAAAHGALRHTAGFDLAQLVSEFRALRATVLRLWIAKSGFADAASANEITRFNEAVDQALAESVDSYSAELSRSRDTFLAILGHDLRNPLAAMSQAMEMLSRQDTSHAKRIDALGSGSRGLAAMNGMVRDLLEYTRSRLGKGIPIVPAAGNFEAVCKSAIQEASFVFPQTAFRFESEGWLDAVFDSPRMHQAISNLLNNSAQHARRGLPVLVIARGDNKGLSLRIISQGVPINAEQLQVIFDPLVPVSIDGTDPRTRTTNLGLGLFVAREILRAHGGTIEVDSSTEGGTTFSIDLPRDLDAMVPGLFHTARVEARAASG